MITPSGERKSWRDMTPEERRQDRFRHFPTLLARWRGGFARIWELTSGHRTLTIRVERKGVRGNLHVACIGPKHIHGPTYWHECNIEVVLNEDGSFVVRDVQAGLEIHAANIEVAENCSPKYTPEKRKNGVSSFFFLPLLAWESKGVRNRFNFI